MRPLWAGLRLVYVEWVDSARSVSWQHFDERDAPELSLCKSVGWLLYEDKHVRTIAPHVSLTEDQEKGQSVGDMTIPVRSIVRMKTLAEPGRTARKQSTARGKRRRAA